MQHLSLVLVSLLKGFVRRKCPKLTVDLNCCPGPPGSDIGMQSMRRYYEDTMKRYMSDLQGRRSPSPEPTVNLAANLNMRREGQALDLTSPPPGSASCGGVPALDLSRQQGRSSVVSRQVEVGLNYTAKFPIDCGPE